MTDDFTADAALRRTEELLAISSVTGDERAIADHVEGLLGELRPHVLARAGNSLCCAPRAADPGKPTLMLVGHTDTVPDHGDNPVRRDGDRLHGLGASDMKAADALILECLRRDAAQPAAYNLVGVLYAREEGPFADNEMPLIRDAARALFDATDLAICMEPTDNQIELGCLGTAHAAVVFTGRRAHSARPWQGENAIHKAAPLLARLAAREPVEHVFDGLRFVEVVSATTVDFRGARNVIPDRFAINVNYRFAPGQSEDDVRAALDALIAGDADYEIVDVCPAGRVCSDNALLAALVEAAGGELETRAKQAWTDVGRLSHWGMDAINWGPGATAQAHQAGEWVSIAAVRRSHDVLMRWLFG